MNIVKLAKLAVETYILEGKIIAIPKGITEELLREKAGVFVTIEKEGKLKGCIGTYLPFKENIAQEIIANAIAAASQDPRFTSVAKEDLNKLSYTVYILGSPEPIKTLGELDPKKYGIIVKARDFLSRTGLLLPDLKGIDTVDAQVFIACQKAGINPKEEEILIYKFKAEKYQ